MPKRINLRVPALTAGLFAVAFALDTGGLFAASDCVAEPNRAPAQGGHWYYHIDRATGRKCWHLTETDPPAGPQTAPAPVPVQAVPAQPAPGAAAQPPFSSFFSSLTSGFTTASVGATQPDTAIRDPRGTVTGLPEAPKVDQVAPRRRQRADAKPAPSPKPANQPRAASLSPAERDALFQEYLRWKERQ
jgi:hypothetical protein